LSKVFLSDQYLEETDVLIVNFSDGSTQAYDLTQQIPNQIKSAIPLENYLLELEFSNGEKKHYNLSNRLMGVFAFLADMEEFRKLRLIQDGKAIAWDYQGETFDLWVDGLYFHSYPING